MCKTPFYAPSNSNLTRSRLAFRYIGNDEDGWNSCDVIEGALSLAPLPVKRE